MKRIAFLLLVVFGVMNGATAQDNALDYYYPLNKVIVLEEIMGEFKIANVTVNTVIVNGIVTSVLVSDPVSSRMGLAYGVTEYVGMEDNAVVLYKRVKYAGADYNEFTMNYPIIKIPLENEELQWSDNSNRTYSAKWIELPMRVGYIEALRIVQSNRYTESVSYWCKSWGCVLQLDENGSIRRVNQTLFDSKIARSDEIVNIQNIAKDSQAKFVMNIIQNDRKILSPAIRHVIYPAEALSEHYQGLIILCVKKEES